MKYTALAVLFLFAASAMGAVVISDNFDSDDGNWNPLFSSTYDVSGGTLNITADANKSLQWVVRQGVFLADFTLNVRLDMSAADGNGAAGISFRTQGNGDAYWIMIYPSGEYTVQKFIGAHNESLFPFRQKNSFINAGSNDLTVIVHGDTMSMLCNGQPVFQLRDSTIMTEGKIGLIATSTVTAAFDSLEVDDAVDIQCGPASFSDDFSSTALFGWRKYDTIGTYAVSGGKLRATGNGTFNFGTLITSGDYGPNDTIQVSAQKISGGSQNYFGLYFHHAYDDSGRSSGYLFAIVNNMAFTVFKMGGGNADTIFWPALSTDIGQTNNTLKVICSAGGTIRLYINGLNVKTITDNTYPSGGSGLMVTSDLVIDYDNFSLSGEASCGPAVEVGQGPADRLPALDIFPNPFTPATKISYRVPRSVFDGRTPIKLAIFDVNGKTVKAITRYAGPGPRYEYTWNAAEMPAGVYFVRLSAGSTHLTRRVILIK